MARDKRTEKRLCFVEDRGQPILDSITLAVFDLYYYTFVR